MIEKEPIERCLRKAWANFNHFHYAGEINTKQLFQQIVITFLLSQNDVKPINYCLCLCWYMKQSNCIVVLNLKVSFPFFNRNLKMSSHLVTYFLVLLTALQASTINNEATSGKNPHKSLENFPYFVQHVNLPSPYLKQIIFVVQRTFIELLKTK